MNGERHGPLYFLPWDGEAWRAHNPTAGELAAEHRRRVAQAWAERIRMTDTLGWWEVAPPLPEILRPAPEIMQVAVTATGAPR